MRYIFDSKVQPFINRYEAEDKAAFMNYLKALPEEGKATALEGYWDLIEADMECDIQWEISLDIADLGDLLYGYWMDLLVTAIENRARMSEDGRCRIGFIEVVCEED